jgi:hypothetical protein
VAAAPIGQVMKRLPLCRSDGDRGRRARSGAASGKFSFHCYRHPYSFHRLSGIPDPVVILKAIACFEYQCCEHPDWAASQARQFCQELRDRCIDRLPGYQQAPWALSDRRIFLRR